MRYVMPLWTIVRFMTWFNGYEQNRNEQMNCVCVIVPRMIENFIDKNRFEIE